ncbi:glycosyltransferase [Streptomyces griseoviridis]|uniref:glycosyltransferase family 4 protein n=1 Tax=Streptomyces griseoviridis TaxID=45398 RepID=UPI00344B71F8
MVPAASTRPGPSGRPGDPASADGPAHVDPLEAARAVFFDATARTAPTPDHVEHVDHVDHEPPGRGPDAAERQAGRWPTAPSGTAGRSFVGPGELAGLLEAEYGPWPGTPRSGPGPSLSRVDAAVAGLRRAARLGVPMPPEALLAHRDGGPRLRSAVRELWPRAVRGYGRAHAEALLRTLLAHPADEPSAGFLLDLAVATALRPLTAVETASLARTTDDRATRHSAWRHLHLLPGGVALLPEPSRALDVYERLLLAPPAPVLGPWSGRPGRLVVQTMLLGGLDTPGQGQSGGLSVLLGGLGDRLAVTDRVAGVITVVTAGHDDLTADAGLAHERQPGHWIVRLPVDTPGPPAPTHEHRAALTWWAVRLLGGAARPPDVVHVRYADDGSLALADAACVLGAATVFTATPDPHRGLARRYEDGDQDDPRTAETLRDELHRVFVADRLVARADTVVGLPGRGGTRELVRHFPRLARLNGGTGPTAPPEGIPPYRPAPDEHVRRREALAALYRGGGHPDALDPEDRGLPLLLTVGRLHPVKQQDLLVSAWLTAGLYRTGTLVLVGGGPGAGTGPESGIRRRIAALLAGRPEAAERLALLPALPNTDVRRLQRALAHRAPGASTWYVCPSAKEEFGIAVLEAMEAGLAVAGPRRGGVAHYLRDQVNGLLMDTSSAAGLTDGLLRLSAVSDDDRRRYAAEGRKLVARRFSVRRTADELAVVYKDLRHRDPARRRADPPPDEP